MLFVMDTELQINLFQTSTMQGTVFSPGGPENLSVGEVPMPGQPEGREVLLTIIFSAINRADTLQVNAAIQHN